MGSGREVRERNTKSQTPSSREIPELKHRKPSSKHRRNPKFQAPNSGPRFALGTWSLQLLWSLELGVWSFDWLPGLPLSPLLRRGEREKTLRRGCIRPFVIYPADCFESAALKTLLTRGGVGRSGSSECSPRRGPVEPPRQNSSRPRQARARPTRM